MTFEVDLAKRLIELKLPVEAIQHESMGAFYKEGWILIVRDLPDKVAVDLIGPSPIFEAIREMLAHYTERE